MIEIADINLTNLCNARCPQCQRTAEIGLDTLKGLDGTQLSYIVTEVLNNNRVNTSSLGYKVESPSDLSEKRNIVV